MVNIGGTEFKTGYEGISRISWTNMSNVVLIVCVAAVIIMLILVLVRYLGYKVKVFIVRVIGNTPFIEQDKGKLKYDKHKGVSHFLLLRKGVNLATLISKTHAYVPFKKRVFGYGESLFLLQDGDDKEIDSYKIINMQEFLKYVLASPSYSGNLISGTSKTEWVNFQKEIIRETVTLKWWQRPELATIINLAGVAIMFVTWIVANYFMSKNIEAMGQGTATIADTMKDIKGVVQSLLASCTSSNPAPVTPP